MGKRNNQEKKRTWGTWEELLLASAVKRHGFKDWDTVAMEVQNRTTLPHRLTTASNCEQKFQDLKQRFTIQCNDNVPNGTDKVDHVPWLEELRKLRVAELRRDVQRSDVSIMSLQLKVKKMVEDRERSLKENEGKDDEKPDLSNSREQNLKNDDKAGHVAKPEPASSEPVRLDDGNKPSTADESLSDRENQSVNESNSTGSRSQVGKIGEDNVKLKKEIEPLPVYTGSKEPNPVGRKDNPVGEESNNGSYDIVAKVPTCESLPPSEKHKVDDSSELRDLVAYSIDHEGGTRESSEVQSSASLTRKRKARRRKEASGSTVGEEPTENEDMSVKSQPLVGVLELIRGHEHISLFECRLESQESDKYKYTVRQHVDLEIIQSRLRKGNYSSSAHLFFRDLLLLFSNAVVFFPYDSTESRTAQKLRRFVTNEIKNHIQTQSDDPISRKPGPISQPKPDSLFSADKASAPILVCRKRSSMSKPCSENVAQKSDTASNENKKPALDTKQPVKPSSSDSDDEPPKVKEKPVTGARILRRSSNNNPSKKLRSGSNPKSGSASKSESTQKNDKSKIDSSSDKKRRAAADFLKRIKRNGTAEALRGSGGNGSNSSSRGGGGGNRKEQKKMGNGGKGGKGKERASRNNGGGSAERKHENENKNSSQSKRSVGRPPKKVEETSAKRGRETSGGKDKRPKKRSRR